MSSDISDEDKKMVAGIIGEKMKEEFAKTLDLMKEKTKLADARYDLTQHKLDAILAYLEKFDKELSKVKTF